MFTSFWKVYCQQTGNTFLNKATTYGTFQHYREQDSLKQILKRSNNIKFQIPNFSELPLACNQDRHLGEVKFDYELIRHFGSYKDIMYF